MNRRGWARNINTLYECFPRRKAQGCHGGHCRTHAKRHRLPNYKDNDFALAATWPIFRPLCRERTHDVYASLGNCRGEFSLVVGGIGIMKSPCSYRSARARAKSVCANAVGSPRRANPAPIFDGEYAVLSKDGGLIGSPLGLTFFSDSISPAGARGHSPAGSAPRSSFRQEQGIHFLVSGPPQASLLSTIEPYDTNRKSRSRRGGRSYDMN